MKIPIIKFFSVLYFNKNASNCIIYFQSTLVPTEIIWDNITIHLRHYDLKGFISKLVSEGYILGKQTYTLTLDSNGNEKKSDNYKELNIIYDENNFINLNVNLYKEILGFLEVNDLFSILGVGGIITSREYSQFSLSDITKAKSNDYSLYEKLINIIIPHNINESNLDFDFEYQDVLCVVSAYNANDTILQVLYALENQDLDDEFYDHFELCLVDDNSDQEIINTIKVQSFQRLRNIRYLKNYSNLNQGKILNEVFVNSRVNQQILLSLDGDIVLEKNYLRNHLIRQNLYQNISTGSCRENSDLEVLKDIDKLSEGYQSLKPDYMKDSRYYKKYNPTLVGGIGESFESRPFEESDYYRTLGHGSVIKGNVNLQMLYKGHNFIMPVDSFRSANYAGRYYEGWGDEDGYIGRKIFAAGTFIVPVISTAVYHINHPPRSFNSIESRDEALKRNVETRNKYLKTMDSYFHIN